MRSTKIDIPIYFGHFNIIVAKDEEDMKEVGRKYDHKLDMSKYGACAWRSYNKNDVIEYYVALQEDASNHLIAHEIVHLVNAVFIHIGAELDRHNDEPQAYLTGWFFKTIEDFLMKRK